VGALPWLWASVEDHFASQHPPRVPGETFGTHVHAFVSHVLPMSLGLQLPITGRWLLGSALSHALVVLAASGIVVWAAVLGFGHRKVLLPAFVAAYPFVYALGPLTSAWQDGRYGVYLTPVLSLLACSAVAAAASSLGGRPKRALASVALAATCVFGMALTVDGARQIAPFTSGPEGPTTTLTSTSWHRDSTAGFLAIARGIEQAGVHHVVASYWVSYVLDFESHGAVVATDILTDRYPAYAKTVQAASRAGWVFYLPAGQTDAEAAPAMLEPGCTSGLVCLFPDTLEAWLRSHGIGYTQEQLGEFLLVVPNSRISLVDAYEAAGIPRSAIPSF